MDTIHFNFDIELAHELRDAINERQNLSIEKQHTQSNNKSKITYIAWDRMCAIMDRLEDTINYVNQMELGRTVEGRSAFDFYEFINCSNVIIDCVKTMGQIFGIDIKLLENIEKSQEVFGQKYSENGTDGFFFEYVRSLCVVHPLFTNRQKVYLHNSKFHCCPFVVWNNYRTRFTEGDLTAVIYNSERISGTKRLPLYVDEFKRYVEKWVNLIPAVIDAKNVYTENVYSEFKKSIIKDRTDFNNDIEYILYLEKEYCKRFGDEYDYIFTSFVRVFKIELTDKRNQKKLELYKNAILYALEFLCNSMKNMCLDGYENSGIKYSEGCIETDLVSQLSCISTYKTSFSSFSYNLGKLGYLEYSGRYSFCDREYARMLLGEVSELINKYVFFTNEESDDEVIVLVSLAQYLDSLNNKTILNQNIPNKNHFRERILEGKELTELYRKETKSDSQNDIDIKTLLAKYGG